MLACEVLVYVLCMSRVDRGREEACLIAMVFWVAKLQGENVGIT